MVIVFAIFCFIFAAAAALIGIVTEYRQTRAEGPVAIVGTMPYAPAAAVFTLFGLLAVRLNWWWYPIAFVTVLVATGWIIMQPANDALDEFSAEEGGERKRRIRLIGNGQGTVR